jgi:hemerythrin-like domain-containing protein
MHANLARQGLFIAGTRLAVLRRHRHGGSEARPATEDAMDAMGARAAENGFESVTAYVGWDHDRLDEALRSVSDAVRAGRFADAAVRYEEVELGQLRHFRIEEELLFPVFEARSGMVNGPTAALRDEHRQARTALGLMRRALLQSDPDPGAYADGLRFVESVLPGHNSREEHILYPTLDGLLRPSERALLVARLLREPVR